MDRAIAAQTELLATRAELMAERRLLLARHRALLAEIRRRIVTRCAADALAPDGGRGGRAAPR